MGGTAAGTKNLLFVVHYPFYGGPQNRALRLSGPLAAAGWKTTVVLPDEPGNAAARLRDGGVDVVTLPLSRLRAKPDPRLQTRFLTHLPGEVKRLRELIRERHADLVVIAGLVNPHAAIAARGEGVPIVWQIIDSRTPPVLRKLMMPYVRRVAAVVMTTGREIASVHEGVTEMGDRWRPFYSPVDTACFRPSRERRSAARAELEIPADALVVGTVGNLSPQKGHEYLLRALVTLRARGRENTILRIIGAPMETQLDYAASLRAEAAKLGLCDGIDFRIVDPGGRVADLLPALDVFVLASVPRSEGVPTAVMEAMSSGLPVVATDVGGVREIVAHGRSGMVVPPLDPEAIAGAVASMIDSPARREAMGKAGREIAVTRFDTSICLETHLRAFEFAVSGGADGQH